MYVELKCIPMVMEGAMTCYVIPCLVQLDAKVVDELVRPLHLTRRQPLCLSFAPHPLGE